MDTEYYIIQITNEEHTVYLCCIIHDEVTVTPFRFDAKLYENPAEASRDYEAVLFAFSKASVPVTITLEERDDVSSQ